MNEDTGVGPRPHRPWPAGAASSLQDKTEPLPRGGSAYGPHSEAAAARGLVPLADCLYFKSVLNWTPKPKIWTFSYKNPISS